MNKIKGVVLLIALCLPLYFVNAESNPYEKEIFLKTDDKGNAINDAVFKQTTISGRSIIEDITVYGSESDSSAPTMQIPKLHGFYEYASTINDSELAYQLLTTSQKAIFDNMKTLDDYLRIKDVISLDTDNEAYCKGKNAYVEHLKKSKGIIAHDYSELADSSNVLDNYKGSIQNRYKIVRLNTEDEDSIIGIDFTVQTFSFIEEVRTPQGLEKSSIIVPMNVTLLYRVNAENGELELRSSTARRSGNLMIYDTSFDYDDVSDVYAKMDDDHLYPVDTDCEESGKVSWYDYTCSTPESHDTTFNSNGRVNVIKIHNSNARTEMKLCGAVVIDKTSSEDLSRAVEIETYVDGKKEASVKKSQEVTVSVKVYNGSKTPLYTNKIVSKVPKGLTYVDGSVIKGGTYNSTDGTVTWTLDYFDSLNTELFSYKVKAPDTVVDGSVYKTTASISSFGEDTPVVSNEARVNAGEKIVNPKTGIISEEIVLVILTISVLAALLIIRKDGIKKI